MGESRPSTATTTLQVHPSLPLPPGPICPPAHTQEHTRAPKTLRCQESPNCFPPLLGERSRCGDAHVLSSSPVWGHAPPDGHMSPEQILGELLWKASWQHVWRCQAAKVRAWINCPRGDTTGDEGWASRFVLFLEARPSYCQSWIWKERVWGRTLQSEKEKFLREPTLWSPERKGDWHWQKGSCRNKGPACQMGWQFPFCANEQELAGRERWAWGAGIHQAAAQSK